MRGEQQQGQPHEERTAKALPAVASQLESSSARDALSRWLPAAYLVGPFTPTGNDGNDGIVRDANGGFVADTRGYEARADVIAAALNLVVTERAAYRSDPPGGSTCAMDQARPEATREFDASVNASLEEAGAHVASVFKLRDGATEEPQCARCPVCNGMGQQSRPPFVAGDAQTWVDAGVMTYPCPACAGTGVVWRPERALAIASDRSRSIPQAVATSALTQP